MAALVLQILLPEPAMEEPEVRVPRIAAVQEPAVETADYASIVQAPVFAPDRKPDPRDVIVPGGPGDLVLIGLATTKDEVAVLIKDTDGEIQRVVTGGEIDGWKLLSADGEEVTLERAGQKRTYPLTAGAAVPVNATAPTGSKSKSGQDDDDEDDDEEDQ